jgi:hypothetical protein
MPTITTQEENFSKLGVFSAISLFFGSFSTLVLACYNLATDGMPQKGPSHQVAAARFLSLSGADPMHETPLPRSRQTSFRARGFIG